MPLSYSTVKLVRIQDSYLATLHYAFMAGIFVYIVIFSIIKKPGYVQFEDPISSARLQLQPPTVGTPTSPTFDPDDPGYAYDFRPLAELPYCDRYNGTKPALTSKRCMYMGALETVFPVTGGSPFFITTRIQESNQTLVCREPSQESCAETYAFGCYASFDSDPECPYTAHAECWGDTKNCWAQRTYFVADVERFTLLLDHTVRAPAIGIAADSSEMEGQLLFCNGTELTPSVTSQGQTFFRIADLLEAATLENGNCGFDMDKISAAPSSHSGRYDGLVMEMVLEYSNTKPWSGVLPHNEIDYKIRTNIINGTKSKVEQEIWVDYPTNRVFRNRHGIKIVVTAAGELGAFNFMTLLTTGTSSLGLLAISTALVDFLALYVLRRRTAYRKSKYQTVEEKELEKDEELDTPFLSLGLGTSEASDHGGGRGGGGGVVPTPSDNQGGGTFRWD